MEKFQLSLAQIREKEYDRKKQIEFNQWQLDYKDHLPYLYDIIIKYYGVNYDDFVRATYETTLPSRKLCHSSIK